MFIAIAVSLVVGVFGGGYGGYRWGRSVEAKAQAVAAALKTGTQAIGAAVKK